MVHCLCCLGQWQATQHVGHKRQLLIRMLTLICKVLILLRQTLLLQRLLLLTELRLPQLA